MSTVKLQSKEGEVFNVDLVVARKSTKIANMMENFRMLGQDEVLAEAGLVLFTQVPTRALKHIITWGTFHKNETEPNQRGSTYVSPWDRHFLQKDMPELIELAYSACALNVVRLFDMCTTVMGEMTAGMPPSEIRRMVEYHL